MPEPDKSLQFCHLFGIKKLCNSPLAKQALSDSIFSADSIFEKMRKSSAAKKCSLSCWPYRQRHQQNCR